MHNLSAVNENKDIVTKEYVDGRSGVTGVKGNSESTYRTGNVNLTAANIGAAAASHNHAASNITSGVLAEARGGTGASSFENAVDGWAYDKAASTVGDYGAMWLEDDDTVHVGGQLPSWYGGVPTGGSAGQVLAKRSNSSNDLEWVNQSGGGSGVDVLYDNDTGSSGPITLSNSIANYDHMRIYYGYETYARQSVDVYNPNGKQVSLFMNQSYDGQYQTIQMANAVASGTTLTIGANAHFETNYAAGSSYNYTQTSSLKVYRVEAWNGGGGSGTGGVPRGGSQGQVLTKTSGDDYDIEWGDFIPTSGGEISGKLIRKSASVDLTKTDNNVSTYWNPVAFQVNDKNDLPMGYLQWFAHNTGYTYVALDARNNVNGTQVTNQLVIRVDKDGTRKVSVTAPAAWRSAIGVTPTVLYNSSTGTTGTVTLSQSAANYDHMRIYYKKTTDSSQASSVDIYQPNGKSASLCLVSPFHSSGSIWFSMAVVTISGTSITKADYATCNIQNGNYTYTSGTNEIYITRVEAWNG